MPLPPLLAVLRCTGAETPSAFTQEYGIAPLEVSDAYGVTKDGDGVCKGCRVPRVSLSIQCFEPHLECASHVIPDGFPLNVSDVLSNGFAERSVLITPRIVALGESLESYPAGKDSDLVVSSASVREELSKVSLTEAFDSIMIRVSEVYLPRNPGTANISEWPYLTVDCANFLNSRFSHYRTNAPSVERRVSHGGMWSHCAFFGVDALLRDAKNPEAIESRTIGELFHIPDSIQDGEYTLVCPFVEMNLDCALTVPLLYPKT